MRNNDRSKYYEATGFTPYWYANIVFNVVRHRLAYLRNIEGLFGDMAGKVLTRPFPNFTSLHCFIDYVVLDVFYESIDDPENSVLFEFIKHIGAIEHLPENMNEDDWMDLQNEEWFEVALNNLIDEIFHILFHDVSFLEAFNSMTSGYLQQYLQSFEGTDRLPRVHVPQHIKDTIYFRDAGECRSCKKDLSRTIYPDQKERFDHIIPLSIGGANDVTNLQLLCYDCNSSKSNKSISVSKLRRKLL